MKRLGWRLVHFGAVAAVTIVFALPLFWMVSSALKPDYEIFAAPPVWWPAWPRWENFSEALSALPFGRYAVNTLIISLSTVLGHLLSCTVVAYGFARLQAPGKGFWFIVLLSTLMLPYPVTMVPLYLIFASLGWVNSFLPLVIPAFFGNAFYIFLLRQAFKQIPPELEDAARLDGAGMLDVLRFVVLPLSQPALVTVALLTFQTSWNDFLAPLIFLHDQSKYTLTLGLSFFRGGYSINWAYLMASALVISLPVLVIYFVAQGSFTKGLSSLGVRS